MTDGAGLKQDWVKKEVKTKLKTDENSSGGFGIVRFNDDTVRLQFTYQEMDEYDNPRMAEVSVPIEGNHPLLQNINWNDGTIKLDVFTPPAGKKE